MILRSYLAGEGPPVVLLHGLFGMARNLGFVQRALAGRFRVEGTEDPLIERRHQGGEAHRRPLAGVTVRERLSSMTLKTRL